MQNIHAIFLFITTSLFEATTGKKYYLNSKARIICTVEDTVKEMIKEELINTSENPILKLWLKTATG